jgi:hypothetical protein
MVQIAISMIQPVISPINRFIGDIIAKVGSNAILSFLL